MALPLERKTQDTRTMQKTENPASLRFHVISSPVGPLGLVASSRGITHLLFNPEDGLKTISQTWRVVSARAELGDEADERTAEHHLHLGAQQLREYFDGERRHFSLTLDLEPEELSEVPFAHGSTRTPSSFRTTAQLTLLNIEYGQTASYGDIAKAIGSPRAARAVGSACATNRIPIIIPCLRVLPTTGKIGNYSGGTGPETKKFLLHLESAR